MSQQQEQETELGKAWQRVQISKRFVKAGIYDAGRTSTGSMTPAQMKEAREASRKAARQRDAAKRRQQSTASTANQLVQIRKRMAQNKAAKAAKAAKSTESKNQLQLMKQRMDAKRRQRQAPASKVSKVSKGAKSTGPDWEKACKTRRDQKTCTIDKNCQWASWSEYCYPTTMCDEFGTCWNTDKGRKYIAEYNAYKVQSGGYTVEELRTISNSVGLSARNQRGGYLTKKQLQDQLLG
jgi:hypothetical protein